MTFSAQQPLGHENNSLALTHWGTKGLSTREVATLVGTSINTIRNWVNPTSPFFVPDFPKPSRIGPRILRWSEADVIRYLRSTQANGGEA